MKKTKKNQKRKEAIRKAISVLVLALVLANTHVFVSQAADPLSETSQTSTALVIPLQTQNDQESSQTEPGSDNPTVQEVLLTICQSRGYGVDCAKTLLGMLWNESSNRSTVIGDNGKARGYFQIHYKLHNISVACAEDLVCSANWSLDYLESNSYPKYKAYAIQCHNSCNVNNGYAAKAIRNGNTFWNQPLEVNQSAPITLAMATPVKK